MNNIMNTIIKKNDPTVIARGAALEFSIRPSAVLPKAKLGMPKVFQP